MKKDGKINLKLGLSSFFIGKCNKKNSGKPDFPAVFLSN